MKNLRFSNNAEAVLAAELPSNPNAPGAHIITVATDGWEDKFSPLDGLYGVDDYLHPSQYPADAECQLVTLTHESNPGEFEVVAVVRHEFGTATFDVKRNIEGASGVSWPVGTLMQARVTAATLESFMQGSAADIPVVAEGVLNIPGGRFSLSAMPHIRRVFAPGESSYDLNLAGGAVSAVGTSVFVDLGVAPTIEDPDGYGVYQHGHVYLPPTATGQQYGYNSFSGGSTDYLTGPPLVFGVEATIPLRDDLDAPQGLLVAIDLPVNVSVQFSGSKIVVEEVGFIADDATATTKPIVSIGDLDQASTPDATRFANNVSLTQISAGGQIHRIPVTAGGGMSRALTFRLDTPAVGGSFRGRFYWRGFLVQD